MRELFMERFEKIFGTKKRLLAVQLNGWYHTVFYDKGTASSEVSKERYGGYYDASTANAKLLFKGFLNMNYKQDPLELVFVFPNER